jgi:membrane protease YdiL (CAAX protease family)
MEAMENMRSLNIGARIPVVVRAIVTGLVIGLVAANVWPLLFVWLGMPGAAVAEAGFLALYLWWAGGGGVPVATREARRAAFRNRALSRAQWLWGIAAALCFAVTVHAALVVLFRLVPYPVEQFRRDYAFVFGLSLPLKWLAIVVAAASAGICEEIGFRGYMQQPIEKRHGAVVAVLVSSCLFAALHLNKSWAIAEMVPIVFGAGVLLGLIAWASGSLIPGILGHTAMDVGMFSYWWSGTAGTFTAKTLAVTGVDAPFLLACAVLMLALAATSAAIVELLRLRR